MPGNAFSGNTPTGNSIAAALSLALGPTMGGLPGLASLLGMVSPALAMGYSGATALNSIANAVSPGTTPKAINQAQALLSGNPTSIAQAIGAINGQAPSLELSVAQALNGQPQGPIDPKK